MKKTMWCVLALLPFITSISNYDNSSFLKTEDFYYENSNLIVRGNINNLDSSTYINDNLNKDLLVFDVNSKIDEEYFAYFYNHETNETFYLETNSYDFNNLEDDLKTFYSESNKVLNNFNRLSLESTSAPFKTLYSRTVTSVEKPFGRMSFNYKLNEYEYSSITSLYLLEVKHWFTSGMNCKINNEVGYDNYKNFDQYVHLHALQSQTDMRYDDIVRSGVPEYKDAYPVSAPSVLTITSTYQESVTFGVSFKNGFSLTNVSLEADSTLGASIGYSYSKGYTYSEPRISSQPGETFSEYQWNYIYSSPDYITNYNTLGYMFECNRYQDGNDVHGRFDLRLDAQAAFKKNDNDNAHFVRFSKMLY